jgi:TolB-like protein
LITSRNLLSRLRERGVLRVAASYAVIAWLLLQIADVALEPFDVPNWVRRAPIIVALLGFPIAIALAWFFELGDRGVTADTAETGLERPVVHGPRRFTDIAIISVLAAIVGFFLLREAGWLGKDASSASTAFESSSLAVLPFAPVGPVPEPYLSEGLSDELRNQFSQMRALSVTARSSSVALDQKTLDAVAIASKLSVAALLEGTVGRERGRLQVSVQLVHGGSGKGALGGALRSTRQGAVESPGGDRKRGRFRGAAALRRCRQGGTIASDQ